MRARPLPAKLWRSRSEGVWLGMLKGMRVIGGEFRSRLLVAPPGSSTRPTSDRLRETLFNVLGPRVAGSRFADLYAGSGAVGMEALSRGAASCLFCEQAPPATKAIQKNLLALGLTDRGRLDARPATRVLQDAVRQGRRFDLIFLDPPYERAEEYMTTLRYLAEQNAVLLGPEALVIAEHAKRAALPEGVGSLRRRRLLEQGDAALSFYAVDRDGDPEAR